MSKAKEIAEECFVSGEISKEEFEDILACLNNWESELENSNDDLGKPGGFSIWRMLLSWVVD